LTYTLTGYKNEKKSFLAGASETESGEKAKGQGMSQKETSATARAELLKNFRAIEAGLKELRDACSGEPDYEQVFPRLKHLMRSIDVAAKLLQHRYVSKHSFISHTASGRVNVGSDCLSKVCGRIMTGRLAALGREQKILASGHIPPQGKSK
jgi:hypothetical protein